MPQHAAFRTEFPLSIPQIPLILVLPTHAKKSSRDRDIEEATCHIPAQEDIGMDVKDFPLVIVFNGIHHFVGTKLTIPNFRDKCDEVADLLHQVKLMCHGLQESTSNKGLQKFLKDTAEDCSAKAYKFQDLFKPGPSSLDLAKRAVQVESGESSSGAIPKRQKVSSTTHQGTTTLTTLHCDCGLLMDSKGELKQHKQSTHASSWICSECPKTFTTGKACRKHYRNIHLNEYLYWCKYCSNPPYGADKKHVVENHQFNLHGDGQSYPCSLCEKMYPSTHSRNQHMKYCGAAKKFLCMYCNRKYKRVKNLKVHHNGTHSVHSTGKLACALCGKHYETMPSYKAHYKGYCFKLIASDAEPIPSQLQMQQELQSKEEEEDDDEDVELADGALPFDFTEVDPEEGGEEEFQEMEHDT